MFFKRGLAAITAAALWLSCMGGLAFAEEKSPIKNDYIFSSDISSIEDFNVPSGYNLSDAEGINYSAVNSSAVVTKSNTTGDDFLLEGKIYKLFNEARIFFNYTDSNNYTEINIGTKVNISEIVGGNKTEICSASVNFDTNCTLLNYKVYRENSRIKLVLNNRVVFDGVTDNISTDSRYGAGFRYAIGYINSIRLSDLLNAESENISGNAIGVNESINISFNYSLDETTVNTDNIYISDNGEKTDLAEVLLIDDKNITVKPVKELEYSHDYSVVITKDVFISGYKHGFAFDKIINFTTEPYPFRAELKTEIRNGQQYAWVEFENNFYSEKDVVIRITAADADGNTLYTFLPQKLKVTVTGQKSDEIKIPADGKIADIAAYVWDNDMHRAFPQITSYPDCGGFVPEIIVKGSKVEISGILPSENSKSSVTFLLGNVNESLTEDSEFGRIAEIVSDENGKFSIVFDMLDSSSGDYEYMIGGDDFEKPYKSIFYYASVDDKNGIVKYINDVFSDSELPESEKTDKAAQKLNESEKLLSLNSQLYKSVSKNSIAEILLDMYSKTPFNENDGAYEFTAAVNEACVISAYNDGNIGALTDGNFNFKNSDIYSFSEFDKIHGTTANEIYEKSDASVRENILKSIINKSCKSISEIHREFVKAAVIWGIKSGSDIKTVLNDNSAFCGMNLSGYLNLKNTADIDSKILSEEFSSVDELEKIINDLISQLDPSVEKYGFLNTEDYIVLNRNDGICSFKPDKLAVNEVSTIGLITKEKYSAPIEISVGMQNSFNQRSTIFAYADNKNYCTLKFDSQLILTKTTDGKTEEIARYESPVDGFGYKRTETKIVIKSGGKIDIYLIYGKNTFTIAQNVTDEAFARSGGFGGQLINTPGVFDMIQAKHYLTVEKTNADSTEFKVGDNAEFEFNYEINPLTANDESISVTASNGNAIPFTSKADGRKLVLNFTERLDYKSEYKITFNEKLHFKARDTGILETETYSFKTENPPVNITELYAKDENGNIIYKENTDILNGEISGGLNGDIDIYVRLKSKLNAPDAVLLISLKNGNDTIAVKKISLPLSAGTEGYAGENDVSAAETTAASFPNVPNGARIEYVILNSENDMNLLYPYGGEENALQNNSEMKCIVNGNLIKVFGTTDRKISGEYVSVIMYSSDNDIVSFSTTKSYGNGEYTAEFSGNFSSDTYKLAAGGREFNSPIYRNIKITAPDDKKAVVRKINSAKSADEVYDILNEYGSALNFDIYKRFGTDNPYNIIDKHELAELIYGNTFKEDDGGIEINEFTAENSAVCAYNQSLEKYLYDENGEMLLKDILDFAQTDINGINVYEFYSAEITEKGKKLIRNGILGGSCKSKADLLKLFAEQTVIHSINNFNSDGYGHINGLLKNNGTYIGLDLSEYNKLSDTSAVDMEIYRADVKSIEDINKILKNIKIESKPSGGGVTTGSGTKNNNKTSSISVPDKTESKRFIDLENVPWAENSINALADRGIISGRENGVFDPNGMITRAELAKIIVSAFDIKADTEELPFDDIDSGSWAYGYIRRAYAAEIINGVDKNRFAPNDFVTRQDAAVMIYRALKNGAETDKNILNKFSDRNKISAYAETALSFMVENKLISGMDGNTIAPLEKSSRAQIAVLVYRAIAKEE